jgi:stearoyl-CoA desaturase (Delta-9 desaturase)
MPIEALTGVLDLPWWGYLVYTLIVTHITIAAVTIFLHRCQSHRALDLHPVASHFFRFWLWLTTGMVTKTWAAIHRKHHARCETEEDPHSPQIMGIRKVLWEGAELYRIEGRNRETLEKYGRGTPDDWLERRLYSKYDTLGIGILLPINFALFGFIGVVIWAVQMAWIPFFAAGVINGVGHYLGYRNFQPGDASTNIVPWGILIGGEELHNNHHAYASSARFSSRWYEFDLGWLYIRVLNLLGLAQVKKIAPKVRFELKTKCDLATVHAVITHRYDVLAKYANSLKHTCAEEIKRLKASAVTVDRSTLTRMLHADAATMPDADHAEMRQALTNSKVLATVYTMRQELTALWQRSSHSKEQLVHQLEDWCSRAEASGIIALQEFSRRLRCYV